MLALLLTGQLLALWSRIKPFLTRTRESMEAPKSIITMFEATNLHVNRMRGGDTYRLIAIEESEEGYKAKR